LAAVRASAPEPPRAAGCSAAQEQGAVSAGWIESAQRRQDDAAELFISAQNSTNCSIVSRSR
jgi:hypothetical protein